MFKAKIARRFSFNDATHSANMIEQGYTAAEEMSPMISNSANLMMGSMYGENNILGGQILGPPEAFFPFTSIDANGHMSRDSPDSFDEDDIDDDDFQLLAMDDLIDFPDEEDEDEDESGYDDENGLTPRPATATSEDQARLMSRPGLVGAFRKNQDDQRILSGSNVSQNSLLFGGRYNTTAIQGIRQGHINAAGTPITPLRKQRKAPVDSSPLATKRKFSGYEGGHKRHKSVN